MKAVLACEAFAGLDVHACSCELPAAVADLPMTAVVPSGAGADPELRAAVRDVLRQRGYRPTGRGKPSSEYLANALAEGRWPRINAVVDACNVASLHSGLPISVVDADAAPAPYGVRCGQAEERYVFNSSGQEIELAGLPCLCDKHGPCANAVKDAQRTKTSASTRRLLAVVWGVDRARPGVALAALEELVLALRALGGQVQVLDVRITP